MKFNKLFKWIICGFAKRTHTNIDPVPNSTGNILPPQECQRRLKLLSELSDDGLPWLQPPTFPNEYFRKNLTPPVLRNRPDQEKRNPRK